MKSKIRKNGGSIFTLNLQKIRSAFTFASCFITQKIETKNVLYEHLENIKYKKIENGDYDSGVDDDSFYH